jgi:cysteine desulfurase/selenocysteine lyase
MGEAIRLANQLGVNVIWEIVQERATLLRARLAEIPKVTVTDVGKVKSGIVSFISAAKSPEEIARHLRARRINVTTSSVASTRFDMEDRGLDKVVRASVHYLTTDEEIELLVSAVRELG